MRAPVLLLIMLIALGCNGPVKERTPQGPTLPEGLMSNAVIGELVGRELDWRLEEKTLLSPDGGKRLRVVGENASTPWARIITGGSREWHNFFGVELERKDSSVTVPVMSLWECDVGCGCISLQAEWATDSSAVRLKGCTTSFRRWGRGFSQFDFLYLPDVDKFYDLAPRNRQNGARGSLSNLGLNPTASRVTALAWQAPRHSVRGLGVRSADTP